MPPKILKRKFQIFVSSTYKDLIVERQAAVSAILKAGHIPAGMELFTSGDVSQMDTIKNWIDESDVYLLIFGGRYGSIEPTSGVSYTELEYDYAVMKNKPHFSIVITDEYLDEKTRLHGGKVLETDNAGQLRAFRTKVLSKISSFFSDLKDIRLAVHESLTQISQRPEVKGWVFAGDIEDTSALRVEIIRLKTENTKIKSENQKSNKKLPDELAEKEFYDDLIDLFRKDILKIPADAIEDSTDLDINVVDFMHIMRDSIILGVTNSSTSSKISIYMYYNLFTQLQIHGLSENERLPGVQYRRSFLNAKGVKFLALIDKEKKRKASA